MANTTPFPRPLLVLCSQFYVLQSMIPLPPMPVLLPVVLQVLPALQRLPPLGMVNIPLHRLLKASARLQVGFQPSSVDAFVVSTA